MKYIKPIIKINNGNTVKHVQYDAHRDMLYIVDSTGSIIVFDTNESKVRKRINTYNDKLVAVFNCTRANVVMCTPSLVIMFNMRVNRTMQSFTPPEPIKILTESRSIIAYTYNKTICVRNTYNNNIMFECNTDHVISSIALVGDICAAAVCSTLYIWDIGLPNQMMRFESGLYDFIAVAVSDDSDGNPCVIVSNTNSVVYMINTKTGYTVGRMQHDSDVVSIAVCDKYIATVTIKHVIHIWDKKCYALFCIRDCIKNITALAFSDDCSSLVVCRDNIVSVYSLKK